ncbi:tyrosine-type recombinase/integrase [Peribacillus simplex]|uniref:tyrosine-type recombinase/integrase n=1 Tax=Peribacillus simplex TaxID=1478 RepID=UPI00298E684B|nr:tyrosine-type recombinase/integrase [Peribacillus simplex]MDW7615162.1 tyrosine-type recombinase/integrase [Peribacillus simplex]
MLNIKSEDFEQLEVYANEDFKLTHSIIHTKQILSSYSNENQFNYCKFNEDTWVLHDESQKMNRYIHFDCISKIMLTRNIDDLKTIVKCWAATLVDKGLVSRTISVNVNNLLKVVTISNGFSQDFFVETIKYIQNRSARTRISVCNAVLNFFDYYPLVDEEGVFTEKIWEIKSKTETKIGIREIPSSQDILKFSMVVEDYFKLNLSDQHYRKYFCIYLWWNLTTIIPLRISEFCDIKRDSLTKGDEGFFLKLPRKKQNNRRIQVIDSILIPKGLASAIKNYLNSTDKYGESTTLISYLSLPIDTYYINQRIDSKSFHSRAMLSILNDFYKNIVCKKYGFQIMDQEKVKAVEKGITLNKIINRKIRPNDTRHFAFLNLMTQGYHPVEIARLGGHVSIYSQYHYHQHLEYWVDSEVMELMLKFNLNRNIGQQTKDIFDEKEFKERFILRPSESKEVNIPLSIGYCIDPNQNCKVDDHFFCDAWRISFEEYKEKADTIKKKINEKENTTKQLINNLKNLYYIAIKGFKSDLNSEKNVLFNRELIETSKQLKHSLYQLAMLREKVTTNE